MLKIQEAKSDGRENLHKKQAIKKASEKQLKIFHYFFTILSSLFLLVLFAVTVKKGDISSIISITLISLLFGIGRLITKKIEYRQYGVVENYYAWNFSLTLKLFLHHIKWLKKMNSITALYIAVVIMFGFSFVPFGIIQFVFLVLFFLVLLLALQQVGERNTYKASFPLRVGFVLLVISSLFVYLVYGVIGGVQLGVAFILNEIAVLFENMKIREIKEEEYETINRAID